MRTLNLGILAHVDAGKTSLTERLLFAAGIIDKIGSVDDGNTQTDTLALERQRGITIKAAVVSFVVDGLTVNLIDTPGHPDFIAEVERVLSVLDGAVLVISAVEGVQAQTRVLMRTLQRLKIPTIIFVNKIDRGGADVERVLQGISEKLTPDIMPMGAAPGLARVALASRLTVADVLRFGQRSPSASPTMTMRSWRAIWPTTAVSHAKLHQALAAQTKLGLVHPVLFGSAITGAGVDALMTAITELLPAAEGDPDGPVSGTVFKVERGRPARRSPMSASIPERCGRATGCNSDATAARRSPRSAPSSAARRFGAARSWRGRSANSGGLAMCRSATRSAPRKRARRAIISRRRRWRR